MDLEELTAVARRACGLLDAGQVEVRADAGGAASAEAGGERALFVAVRDGRGGRAEATSLDDAALARAAKAAWVQAGRMRAWPVPPLPEPARAHPDAAGPDGGGVASVVASTTGVLAAERFAVPQALPAGADTVAGVGRRLARGAPVVLAPAAVAALLHALRGAFGVDAALAGGPPAIRLPEAITLVDDATGQRRYDAEGTPRQRVVLVEGGVPVARVRDASSAPSTGHATLALTLAPRPDHLQLAAGVAELAAFLPGAAVGEDQRTAPHPGATARHGEVAAPHLGATARHGEVAAPHPGATADDDEVAALRPPTAAEALALLQRVTAVGRDRQPVGPYLAPAVRLA